MSSKLKFVTLEGEVGIPEGFHRFSGLVAQFIEAFLEDVEAERVEELSKIPLPSIQRQHLENILTFFDRLFAYSPTEYSLISNVEESAKAVENVRICLQLNYYLLSDFS